MLTHRAGPAASRFIANPGLRAAIFSGRPLVVAMLAPNKSAFTKLAKTAPIQTEAHRYADEQTAS